MHNRTGCALVAAAIVMATAGIARAQDPLEVGPDVYTKNFENERVRVLTATFLPGQRIAMHSHPDHLAYILDGGTLTLTHPDGQSQTIAGKAGQVIWIPAESHATVNTGLTMVRVLVIELKEPAQTPGAAAGPGTTAP